MPSFPMPSLYGIRVARDGTRALRLVLVQCVSLLLVWPEAPLFGGLKVQPTFRWLAGLALCAWSLWRVALLFMLSWRPLGSVASWKQPHVSVAGGTRALRLVLVESSYLSHNHASRRLCGLSGTAPRFGGCQGPWMVLLALSKVAAHTCK